MDQSVKWIKGSKVINVNSIKDFMYNPVNFGFTQSEVTQQINLVKSTEFNDEVMYDKQILEKLEELLFIKRWIKFIHVKDLKVYLAIVQELNQLERYTLSKVQNEQQNGIYIYENISKKLYVYN